MANKFRRAEESNVVAAATSASRVDARPQQRSRQQQQGQRWLALEPLWLLGLAPSLLFTEYFWDLRVRPLLILALFLFWPLRMRLGKRLLPTGLLGWLVGFLLIWPLFTLWLTGDRPVSWEVLGYYYWAWALFTTLTRTEWLRQRPTLVILGLTLLGVGLAIFGPEAFSADPDKIFDLYSAPEITTGGGSLWAETINPNILGGALVMILPLLLAPLLRWPRQPYGWLVVLLVFPVAIMVNTVVITQSRGAWLGLAGAVGVLMTLRWPPLRYGWLALGGLALLIWMSGAQLPFVGNTLIQNAGASLVRRLAIWQYSLAMVRQAPITGIGVGLYAEVFLATYPALMLPSGRLVPPHAHNLYLQIALDLGVPGLLAFVAYIVRICTLLATRWQRALATWQQREDWALRAGLCGALTAFLLCGIFDNALWGTKLWLIPMTIAALAYRQGK